NLRLHLLRPARYERAGFDLYRHRAVVASGDDVLRPPGGADRGKLYSTAALQRHLARLSACLDHRRWSLAVYRYGAVCNLSVELPDSSLLSPMWHYRHHRDGAADGLHQQGHLAGIRRRVGRHGGAGTTKPIS